MTTLTPETIKRVLDALKLAELLPPGATGEESGRVAGKAMVARIHVEAELEALEIRNSTDVTGVAGIWKK